MPASRSIDALTVGCTRSASTVASAKNGRNDSFTPWRWPEVGLGLVAQLGDPGDVDLDHRGELGRDLQRLDHPLGDDGAQPGHLLGAAAQRARARPWRRPAWPSRARPAAGRGAAALAAASSTSCLRIRPPTPVPVERGQVDAVLGGELADQRGDVAVRRRRRWPRPRRAPARAPGPGPAPAAREPAPAAGAGAGAAAGAGAGAGGREPAGAGAAGAGARGRGGCRGAGAAPAAPMTAELGADRGGLVLGDLDLQHGAGDRRRDLGVDLVGGDLEQRLVRRRPCRRPA